MSDNSDNSVQLSDAELEAVAGAGARTTINTFRMVGGLVVKGAGSLLGNESMIQHGREMIEDASARLSTPGKKN